MNGGWGISYEIALRWMTLDLTGDKSTLVQVMAWCCQASRQQVIIWSNVDPDLCRQMASLGLNVLTHGGVVMPYGDIDLVRNTLNPVSFCHYLPPGSLHALGASSLFHAATSLSKLTWMACMVHIYYTALYVWNISMLSMYEACFLCMCNLGYKGILIDELLGF